MSPIREMVEVLNAVFVVQDKNTNFLQTRIFQQKMCVETNDDDNLRIPLTHRYNTVNTTGVDGFCCTVRVEAQSPVYIIDVLKALSTCCVLMCCVGLSRGRSLALRLLPANSTSARVQLTCCLISPYQAKHVTIPSQ